jgi:hypothetical protein
VTGPRREVGGQRIAGSWVRSLVAAGLALTGGCTDRAPSSSAAPPLVDVPVEQPMDGPSATGESTAPGASLARAGGSGGGRRYTVAPVRSPGTLVGRIAGGAPVDTTIAPTRDADICKPFTETLVPSLDGGVGRAVVWLEGVVTGPADDAPRRVPLVLDRCRLEPRLQRVAVGGTVMVNGRDAIFARLQFVTVGQTTPLTTVLLSDVGQVVPVSAATGRPGLIRLQDDRHPWIRAWLVVSPHPFVSITEPDGRFAFDGVPPGRYELVAWHERLGERRLRVRIEGGVRTTVELDY